MRCGIVGLPNVGKSTLFNAMTEAKASASNYLYSTVEPNESVVAVPDARLDVLAKMYEPKKITPARMEFVDIAGLARGAAAGEGLGNRFLSHIREVDALIHVVRCFEDEDILHVDGSIDAARDVRTLQFELVLADLETVEKRIERVTKQAKGGDKKLLRQLDFYNRMRDHLEEGGRACALEVAEEEQPLLRDLFLLTSKPVLYVANVAEDDAAASPTELPLVQPLYDIAREEGAALLVVSAKAEEDIAQLPTEERAEFLEAMGLAQSGLSRLIAAGYALLGLISFLTAGTPEVRAWTIRKGTKAQQAAGKIHSDIERGFIRAETVAYDDLIASGSMAAAKEKGLVRLEGKEYVVQDGDVLLFRFNV